MIAVHDTLALVLGALALGALHSFAPDHLAAVSVFVSRCPSWRHAAALGARWGLGHSATIVGVGGVIALSGAHVPEPVAAAAERAVGGVLILVGVLGIWRAAGALRAGLLGHAAPRSGGGRALADGHGHRALLGIGMLHGLAGTGALIALLPLALGRSAALLFLLAFGAGTIASMAVFSAAAGHSLRLATRSSPASLHAFSVAAGALSIGIGVWWAATGGG